MKNETVKGRTGKEPQEWERRPQLAKDAIYPREGQQEMTDSSVIKRTDMLRKRLSWC